MAKPKYSCFLWEGTKVTPLIVGLKIAAGTSDYYYNVNQPSSVCSNEYCSIGFPDYTPSLPSEVEAQCLYCCITFESREDCVAHYKTDWHLCNLRRSIDGRSNLTEEQFLKSSDLSSISGSESEREDNSQNDVMLRRNAKMFFVNSDGIVISLYRCLLTSKYTEMSEDDLGHMVNASPSRLYWVIVLIGGGHFAAAVFKGSDIIAHKTFHSYTVRAKQGSSQLVRDNRSGSSHPKSAGASLRRYNEQAFHQHVQDLLESWKDYFEHCHFIFFRAAGRSSQLLYGKKALIKSDDRRLCSIPFSTRRPTFSEVKRIHQLLASVDVYGSESEFTEMILKAKDVTSVQNIKLQRSPEKCKQEKVDKHSKRILKSPKQFAVSKIPSSETEDDDGVPIEFVMQNVVIHTSGLKEFGSSVEDERKTRRFPKKKSSNNMHDGEKENKAIYNAIYTCCKTGDLSSLEKEFENTLDLNEILTHKFGHQQKSLLHISAEASRTNIVWFLLEQGCDPCVKDVKDKVPYSVSGNRETRDTFRLFMAEFPEKYDYKRRALAAERRILVQIKDSEKMVLSRCFQCANDITGIVPFEYSDCRFCSTACVKEHRKKCL